MKRLVHSLSTHGSGLFAWAVSIWYFKAHELQYLKPYFGHPSTVQTWFWHSVQLSFRFLCGHKALPLQSLHLPFRSPCSQIPLPTQSLHIYLCFPCGHILRLSTMVTRREAKKAQRLQWFSWACMQNYYNTNASDIPATLRCNLSNAQINTWINDEATRPDRIINAIDYIVRIQIIIDKIINYYGPWNAITCLGRFPGLQTMPIQMGNASAGRPHPRIPTTTILTMLLRVI